MSVDASTSMHGAKHLILGNRYIMRCVAVSGAQENGHPKNPTCQDVDLSAAHGLYCSRFKNLLVFLEAKKSVLESKSSSRD